MNINKWDLNPGFSIEGRIRFFLDGQIWIISIRIHNPGYNSPSMIVSMQDSPCLEPGRAGGEYTAVGGELPAVHLQDDVTEPTLLSLQPAALS